MELPIRYRGRQATSEEVALIRQLIAENPEDSRRALSVKLCRALNWVQPNGALRDMVCRGYMLALLFLFVNLSSLRKGSYHIPKDSVHLLPKNSFRN